jgi:hypothetical protein
MRLPPQVALSDAAVAAVVDELSASGISHPVWMDRERRFCELAGAHAQFARRPD